MNWSGIRARRNCRFLLPSRRSATMRCWFRSSLRSTDKCCRAYRTGRKHSSGRSISERLNPPIRRAPLPFRPDPGQPLCRNWRSHGWVRCPTNRRGSAGARGVLEFRFRQKAIFLLAGLPVEPADERLCIPPADANYRMIAPAMVYIVLNGFAFAVQSKRRFHSLSVAHGVACAGFPLIPRDWSFAHRKRICDRDLVLPLVFVPVFLRFRRTHDKRAGRNNHHLRTRLTILKSLGGTLRCVCGCRQSSHYAQHSGGHH